MTTIPPRNRVTSSSLSREINLGCWSADKMIGAPLSMSALNVWRNSSCVARFAARKWISSTISPPALRKRHESHSSCRSALLPGNVFVKTSAVELNDISRRVSVPQRVADAFQQVGFPKPDCAVDNQRVKRSAGRLSHLACSGMGHPVPRPGHEVFESFRRTAGRCRPLEIPLAAGPVQCDWRTGARSPMVARYPSQTLVPDPMALSSKPKSRPSESSDSEFALGPYSCGCEIGLSPEVA